MPHRSWNGDAPVQPPSTPTLLYSLAGLEEQLKAAYKLVTEGKFSEALKVFNRMLHTIPLVVVETRKEVSLLAGRGWAGVLGVLVPRAALLQHACPERTPESL